MNCQHCHGSQWRSEETTIAIEIAQFDRLGLPTITVCAQVPFKRLDLDAVTEEQYLANTYDLADIFPNAESNAMWTIRETRSFEMGRCYTLTTEEKVKAVCLDQYLLLRPGIDVNIYGKAI